MNDFEVLAGKVISQADGDAFFAKGSATEIVTILRCMKSLRLKNDDFFSLVMESFINNFDELSLNWSIISLKEIP